MLLEKHHSQHVTLLIRDSQWFIHIKKGSLRVINWLFVSVIALNAILRHGSFVVQLKRVGMSVRSSQEATFPGVARTDSSGVSIIYAPHLSLGEACVSVRGVNGVRPPGASRLDLYRRTSLCWLDSNNRTTGSAYQSVFQRFTFPHWYGHKCPSKDVGTMLLSPFLDQWDTETVKSASTSSHRFNVHPHRGQHDRSISLSLKRRTRPFSIRAMAPLDGWTCGRIQPSWCCRYVKVLQTRREQLPAVASEPLYC